ncbi:uncharacterized protein LOC128650283 isoform X2 [Bombina bombina]|uniref:uncharacterized protein LOC128650283 isoform X2 n=1 Tax=Bombina bombina TaxID=8345 RepID=UPI00235A8843|nr:uncharacterized protein LOC128650283 isoform X2 [Bombina bombina]
MATPAKKAKTAVLQSTADYGTTWIRICDAFIRTDGRIICPVIKAERSIQVFYKLQEKSFKDLLEDAAKKNGLRLQDIQYSKENECNIFIKFAILNSSNDAVNQCKLRLRLMLTEKLKVTDILIDEVQGTEETIPQPIISETDFEMRKLSLCYEKLSAYAGERDDLYIAAENIKAHTEDLRDVYTKFAVLSQNGKGKSFILNLLLLLTADNEEEYEKNNKDRKWPRDIPQNTAVEDVPEKDLLNLPEVVKDFLKTVEDKTKNFGALTGPLCHQLSPVEDIKTSLKSLSGIDTYFSKKKRHCIDPYVLPQKELTGSYQSTTKCIVHLRYGTLYQLSVNYFNIEELQNQLFELITLNENDGSKEVEIALECLKTRYNLLTGQDIFEDNQFQQLKQRVSSPTDITISDEVQKFAGITELYYGQGKSSAHDRLALQAVLRGLTTPQEEDEDKGVEFYKKISAVKKIVVYLPSKILYGEKEILEMPGTDDSDPMAMDFIYNALKEVDGVILVNEFSFKVCATEVKNMLSGSDFIKHLKKDPTNYKLMLLSYPEKSNKWQFGKYDDKEIKKVENEERKKRIEELKTISKVIKMDPLEETLANNIMTSYILPVLHTSILAQKDVPEYQVLINYEDFLKHTGIQNLIVQLDKFVSFKRETQIKEIKDRLCSFQKELQVHEMSMAEANSIEQTWKNKDVKFLYENLNRENLLTDLNKNIKELLKGSVSNHIKETLSGTVITAKDNWNKIKGSITSVGVYSPYFCGKNPIYKVCLYYVFFDGLEDKISEVFEMISSEIKRLIEDYKGKVIQQYTENLSTMLNRSLPKEFVETAIENHLDDALEWYVGKKKRPFNITTMRKLFEESQKRSLKDNILTPNFKKDSLENAKIKTEKKLEYCITKVNDYFIDSLFSLHEERWKSLTGRLSTPKGSSKMWQQLISYIKLVARGRETCDVKENLSAVCKMMSAELY